jgi:hypothetical protein
MYIKMHGSCHCTFQIFDDITNPCSSSRLMAVLWVNYVSGEELQEIVLNLSYYIGSHLMC